MTGTPATHGCHQPAGDIHVEIEGSLAGVALDIAPIPDSFVLAGKFHHCARLTQHLLDLFLTHADLDPGEVFFSQHLLVITQQLAILADIENLGARRRLGLLDILAYARRFSSPRQYQAGPRHCAHQIRRILRDEVFPSRPPVRNDRSSRKQRSKMA